MIERIDLTCVHEANLLGEGGESQVYALDENRVLRLYRQGSSVEYIGRRQAFYELLASRAPAFEVPAPLATGSIEYAGEERQYVVEKRMKGRSFGQVLPMLAGEARQRALGSYLQVAQQIGEIRFPDHQFGELLAFGEPIKRATWEEFLRDRMDETLRGSRNDVVKDLPEFEAIWMHFQDALGTVSGQQEKRLVHGDYCPPNVFIDENLNVCGVGDFGYTTLVGDPRMDVAAAVAFLEVGEGYEPADTQFLSERLAVDHGPAMLEAIALYRLYYSVYFSYCRESDANTYWWCISNFKRYADQIGIELKQVGN